MRCLGCSKGCRTYLSEGNVIGCQCAKGINLINEAMLSNQALYKYYLPVNNGYMKHILIVSDQQVAYTMFEALDELMQGLVLEAPIQKDQVILAAPLGLPINLVATRRLKHRK